MTYEAFIDGKLSRVPPTGLTEIPTLNESLFVGVKDSYESTYQAIRRCWRFGQTRPVHVHVFAGELEGEVVKNLERKERDAYAMAEALSSETREVVRAEILGQKRQTNAYKAETKARVPAWM